MSRFLLALLIGALATLSARADSVLTFGILPSSAVVPQSKSNPAIIAGSMAQQPTGFGFNNYGNTGNLTTATFFSTNMVGGSLGSGIEVGAIPYTVGQLANFSTNFSFAVAIDVNSAEGGNPPTIMQLIGFDLFRVDSQLLHLDRLAHIDQTYAMPDIRPGNGKGDYLLTGFDLSGLNVGDFLIFRAQFSGATDGPDSFYLLANPNVQPVPLPAGVWLFGTGLAGLALLSRRRRAAV